MGRIDVNHPGRDEVGTRDDVIRHGRNAAALVYQRNKHVINLFIWPSTEASAAPTLVAGNQGYHLIRWNDGGMACWAVSDLNETELMEFSRAFDRK